MNLYDFNHKNHEKRIALIRTQGEFLAVRVSNYYVIKLYSVDKFFAEIWYRGENCEVGLVRGFTGIALLEPYLEMVDLSEITE
ncbi:hypothetical protein [Adhaeribacter radiodurans]|uniref:Uncharacterized protein n=1 Tax=Adhaeribacter radiodurans TaxID=2745197 RepID=A0A7L7LCH7_9BACT|nr:hypothetical protein [Adhaeribacter radiodurans]QMU30447.1 hypothetical protein HUW48_21555 [Adhaeribacter radiodurans]